MLKASERQAKRSLAKIANFTVFIFGNLTYEKNKSHHLHLAYQPTMLAALKDGNRSEFKKTVAAPLLDGANKLGSALIKLKSLGLEPSEAEFSQNHRQITEHLEDPGVQAILREFWLRAREFGPTSAGK